MGNAPQGGHPHGEAGLMDPARVLFVDKIGSFLPALEAGAHQAGFEVSIAKGVLNREALHRYGVIWCSWADELAVGVSQYKQQYGFPGKLVVQLRSYEAYQRVWMEQMAWAALDAVVYVAEHVRAAAELPQGVPHYFLPTCVDLSKWPNPVNIPKEANKIAWVGRHSPPKNSELVIFLAQNCPDYQFYLLGPMPDRRFRGFIDYLHLPNVHILENDTPQWWQASEAVYGVLASAAYIVSPSTHESTHLALLEGMAMGCRPLVYDRPGLFVGREHVFSTVAQFSALLAQPRTPAAYRAWVERHRAWPRHHTAMGHILDRLVPQPRRRPWDNTAA